ARSFRNWSMSARVGGCPWASLLELWAGSGNVGSGNVYTVFEELSQIVTWSLLQRIWASPASDCSSIRPRPSGLHQSRPEPPEVSAELEAPGVPASAPEGKRLFVKCTRAVIPAG